MPKFNVVLVERITYVVEVEAEDEAEASELAEELFVQSDNPFNEFGRDVERNAGKVWRV